MYELLDDKCWKDDTLGYEAKTLASIAFSLWRAAFLADKTGALAETNKHTKYFLGEMLATNAINFAQDRKGRGFTFNYYLANVRFRLLEYKHDNSDFEVDDHLLEKGKLNHMKPAERWSAYQRAFTAAVRHFQDRLRKSSSTMPRHRGR